MRPSQVFVSACLAVVALLGCARGPYHPPPVGSPGIGAQRDAYHPITQSSLSPAGDLLALVVEGGEELLVLQVASGRVAHCYAVVRGYFIGYPRPAAYVLWSSDGSHLVYLAQNERRRQILASVDLSTARTTEICQDGSGTVFAGAAIAPQPAIVYLLAQALPPGRLGGGAVQVLRCSLTAKEVTPVAEMPLRASPGAEPFMMYSATAGGLCVLVPSRAPKEGGLWVFDLATGRSRLTIPQRDFEQELGGALLTWGAPGYSLRWAAGDGQADNCYLGFMSSPDAEASMVVLKLDLRNSRAASVLRYTENLRSWVTPCPWNSGLALAVTAGPAQPEVDAMGRPGLFLADAGLAHPRFLTDGAISSAIWLGSDRLLYLRHSREVWVYDLRKSQGSRLYSP